MKKGWKIYWIICGVTAAVGIMFCFVGVGLGATVEAIEERFPNGMGIVRTDGYAEETSIYPYGGTMEQPALDETFLGIRKVEIEVSGIAVQILESHDAGGAVKLEATELDPSLNFRCEQDGDKLKVETRRKLKNQNAGTVWLYVPKGILKSADIDMKTGAVYVENIQAEEFKMDVGAGEAVVENFSAKDAKLKCGAGRIEAAGEIGSKADIDCGVGEILFTVQGRQRDYNYKVDCGIGEVILGESEYAGLGVSEKIDNGASRELHVDCGVGSAEIYFTEEQE